MKLQKSIRCYGQLIQDQFKELLSSPELKGRIMLGSTEDFEWQQLDCIVPIKCPAFRPEDLTTIKILVRFNAYRVPMTPGLYIDSNLIPPQIRFINITEDIVETENIKTVKEVVHQVVRQIDSYGLQKWAQKTYEAHLSYNKMNQKIHQVNLNQNQMIQQKSNINGKMENQKNKEARLESLGSNLQLLSNNKEYYSNSSFNSAFRFKNCQQEQQQKLIKQKSRGNQQILPQGFRPFSESMLNICKIDQQSKPKDDKTNTDQNPCRQNFQTYLRKEDSFSSSNQMFISAFSSFKPISSQNSFSGLKNKEKNNNKIEVKRNEEFLKTPTFGFVPFSSMIGEKQPQESALKSFKANPEKIEESLKAEVFSINQYPQSMVSSAGDKHSKHPKPMNKNANLPKFLIRIFIKYVDKFKGMYVKKQYDRLYAECKKMKEWKKNDRRQHAFGLKHLKIFFQDVIEGFPDPKLNRRVISKIIDNFLLEEICQNSQIPESHRVGYLIACRVYSIRCRNISLAGRIQSK